MRYDMKYLSLNVIWDAWFVYLAYIWNIKSAREVCGHIFVFYTAVTLR